MGTRFYILTFIIVAFASVGFASLPDTECMTAGNQGHPACQKPFYADDQAEYWYDLGASWAFHQGGPDDTGPTVFEPGEAGEIEDGFSSDEVVDDGDTKREYYIQDAGEAEGGAQQQWGRGLLQSTLIDFEDTETKTGIGPLGEYLINYPFEGECGDGRQNWGSPSTCPQDWGTPEVVVLDGEGLPRSNNNFEEPSGTEEFEQIDIGLNSGEFHLEGSKEETAPDYYAEDGHIVKEEVEGPDEEEIMSGTHYYPAEKNYHAPPDVTSAEPNSRTDICVEGDCDPDSAQEVCYDSEYMGEYVGYEENEEYEETDEETITTKAYDAQTMNSPEDQTLKVEVTYDTDAGLADPLYEPKDCQTELTECAGSPQDCTMEEEVSYYFYDTGPFTTYWEATIDWGVTYDDFGLSTSNEWGHVNDEPGMFDNIDVVNSVFGYHSAIDRSEGHGSNDPSVSANQYELIEGSTYFEAHRTDYFVANADGPDGEGNGYIAYDENEGVKGVSDGVFETEYWQGSEDDYITESDLPDIECPGDTIRCVVAIDVYTKQSGWSTNPADSFKIDY